MQQLDTVQNNEWIPTGADIKDTVRVVDTLPLASEAELGKAYLLTGTMTDANGVTFTKTHFYRCVKADNGTGYAWEDMNVGRYTLGNCTNIQIRVYNDGSTLRVILSWNDPVDLVYGENRVHWKETRLVSQLGHMPTSPTDGKTIDVFTRRDAQAEFGSYSFSVDKVPGRTYYFKLFPVSFDDAITNDDENGRCAAFNYTAYTAEHPWTSGERQWQAVPVGSLWANNTPYYTKKSDGTYTPVNRGTVGTEITRDDLWIPTDRVCVYNEMLYVKEKDATTGEWEYVKAMTDNGDGTYTPISKYFKQGTYYNLNGVSTADEGSNWFEFTTRAYYKYESAYLNWAGIKQLIRNGTCEQYLPIGTELQVPYHGDYGTMTFEVVDYDTVLPADRSVKHTMTLHAKMLYQWWDLNTGIVFDTYEAAASRTKDTSRDWNKIYFTRLQHHRANGVQDIKVDDPSASASTSAGWIIDSDGKLRITGKSQTTATLTQPRQFRLNTSDETAPCAARSDVTDNEWYSYVESVRDDSQTSPFAGDPYFSSDNNYECELPWATAGRGVAYNVANKDRRDPGSARWYGCQVPTSSPPKYRYGFSTNNPRVVHFNSDIYGYGNTVDTNNAYYLQLTVRDSFDPTDDYYTKNGSDYTLVAKEGEQAVTESNFKTKVEAGLYVRCARIINETNFAWHWSLTYQSLPARAHTGRFTFDWLYRGHDPFAVENVSDYTSRNSFELSGLRNRLPRNNGYADRFELVQPWRGDPVKASNNGNRDWYRYSEDIKYYCLSDPIWIFRTPGNVDNTNNSGRVSSTADVYITARDCTSDLYAIRVSLEAWRPKTSGTASAIGEESPVYPYYAYTESTSNTTSLKLEEMGARLLRVPTSDRIFQQGKRYWKLNYVPVDANHVIDISENWYFRPVDGVIRMKMTTENRMNGCIIDENQTPYTFYPHGNIKATKRNYMRRVIPKTYKDNNNPNKWADDEGTPLYYGRWTRLFDAVYTKDPELGFVKVSTDGETPPTFKADTVYYDKVGGMYNRLYGHNPNNSQENIYQGRHLDSRLYVDYIVGTPIADVLYTPHTVIPFLNEVCYLTHKGTDNMSVSSPSLTGTTFWTCDGKTPVTSLSADGTILNAWLRQDHKNAVYDKSREYYEVVNIDADDSNHPADTEKYGSNTHYVHNLANSEKADDWTNANGVHLIEDPVTENGWSSVSTLRVKKMGKVELTEEQIANWETVKSNLYCYMFSQTGTDMATHNMCYAITGDIVPEKDRELAPEKNGKTWMTDYYQIYEGAFIQKCLPLVDRGTTSGDNNVSWLVRSRTDWTAINRSPVYICEKRRMKPLHEMTEEFGEHPSTFKFRADRVYYYRKDRTNNTVKGRKLCYPINDESKVDTSKMCCISSATSLNEINTAFDNDNLKLVYVVGSPVKNIFWGNPTNWNGGCHLMCADRYMPDRNYVRDNYSNKDNNQNFIVYPYTEGEMEDPDKVNTIYYHHVDREPPKEVSGSTNPDGGSTDQGGDGTVKEVKHYVNGRIFNPKTEYTGASNVYIYEVPNFSHIPRIFWKKANLERVGYGNHVWAQSNIRLYMNGPFDESARYIVANDPTFIQNRHYYSYDTTRREYYKLTDGGTNGSNTATSYRRGSSLDDWYAHNPGRKIYFKITGGMPVGFKLDPNSPRSNWEFGCSPCQQYKYDGNKWQPVFADTDYWWKAQPSVNNGLIYDRLAEMYWPNAIIKDGTFGVTDGDKTIKFSQTSTHATRSGTANTFSTAPINGYTGMAANGSGVINISGGRRIPMQSFLHGFLDCEYFRTNDQTWVDGKTYYFKSPYGIYEEADTSNLKAGLGSTPYSNCLYERNPNYLSDIKEAYEFLSGIVPVINFNGMYGNRDNLDYYHASGNGTTTVDKVWLMSVAQVAGGDGDNAGVYENVLENAELTALGKYNSYKYALKRFRICGNHPAEMGFSSLNASRIKYNITLAAHVQGGYADSTTAAQYWWLRSVITYLGQGIWLISSDGYTYQHAIFYCCPAYHICYTGPFGLSPLISLG